jgi:hypothetical protein
LLKHIAEFFAIEKNIRRRSAKGYLIRWQRSTTLGDEFSR